MLSELTGEASQHSFNSISRPIDLHVDLKVKAKVQAGELVDFTSLTRAVLRLECSLDCISGSPTKYFHFLTVSVSFEIKKM